MLDGVKENGQKKVCVNSSAVKETLKKQSEIVSELKKNETLTHKNQPILTSESTEKSTVDGYKSGSILQKAQDGAKTIISKILKKDARKKEESKEKKPKSVKFSEENSPISKIPRLDNEVPKKRKVENILRRSPSTNKINKVNPLVKQAIQRSTSTINLNKKADSPTEKINTNKNNATVTNKKIELEYGKVTILRSQSMTSLYQVEKKNNNNDSANIKNNEKDILIFDKKFEYKDIDEKIIPKNTPPQNRTFNRSISSSNLSQQASFLSIMARDGFLRRFFNTSNSKIYSYDCYYRYNTVFKPGYEFGVDNLIPIRVPYYYFKISVDNECELENEYSIRFVLKKEKPLRFAAPKIFSHIVKNVFLADDFDAFLINTLEPSVLLSEYSVPTEMRRFCFFDYQKNDILPEFIHNESSLIEDMKPISYSQQL